MARKGVGSSTSGQLVRKAVPRGSTAIGRHGEDQRAGLRPQLQDKGDDATAWLKHFGGDLSGTGGCGRPRRHRLRRLRRARDLRDRQGWHGALQEDRPADAQAIDEDPAALEAARRLIHPRPVSRGPVHGSAAAAPMSMHAHYRLSPIPSLRPSTRTWQASPAPPESRRLTATVSDLYAGLRPLRAAWALRQPA